MRIGVGIAALLIGLAAGHANPGDEARAKALYQAGSEAYQAGRYAVAIEAFEAAHGLVERPALVFSMAQAYRIRYFEPGGELRHLEQAVASYRRYLELVPEGRRRSHAAQFLSTLVPLLEAKRIASNGGPVQARRATLIVSATVPETVAQIDDGPAQPVPATFEVEPGQHTVAVSAPGYRAIEKTVLVAAGQAEPVLLNPAPEPARVTVEAPAGAQVYVGGRAVGRAPLTAPVELLPGRHQLAVTRRGHVPVAQDLQLANGERLTVGVALEPTGQRALAWGLMGTGAALLVGGGVTTFLALDAESEAQALERRLDRSGLSAAELREYRSLESTRDGWKDATIGLGVGAAVVGVAGVLLWIFDTPSPPRGAPIGDGGGVAWAW